MNFKIKNLLHFILLIPALSYAHVHEIVHMRNNEGQNIYFFDECYTYENGNNIVNTQQRKDFIELAQQLNAAVIVQDYHIYNTSALSHNFARYDNNHYSCTAINLLTCNRQKTFLDMLSAWCHHAQLPVTNIDFRFCEHANTLEEIKDFCDRIKKEIEHYQDGPFLNKMFKQTLKKFATDLDDELINLRSYLKTQESSLTEKIISQTFYADQRKNRFDSINNALTPLLTLRALHILKNQYQNQKNVFIVMWHHKEKLCPYLTQLGYRLVNETKSNVLRMSYDLGEALYIGEVFKTWGMPIKTKKKSIANYILAMQNYIEQKNLNYILNEGMVIGLPIGLILAYCVDSMPLKSLGSKLLVGLALLQPSLDAVDSLITTPITRKNTLNIFTN